VPHAAAAAIMTLRTPSGTRPTINWFDARSRPGGRDAVSSSPRAASAVCWHHHCESCVPTGMRRQTPPRAGTTETRPRERALTGSRTLRARVGLAPSGPAPTRTAVNASAAVSGRRRIANSAACAAGTERTSATGGGAGGRAVPDGAVSFATPPAIPAETISTRRARSASERDNAAGPAL
jgi:hypothetical protein